MGNAEDAGAGAVTVASEVIQRVRSSAAGVVGFMLERRPGDYSFMRVDEFMRCQYARGSRAWTLHNGPVPGCPQEPVVYLGWCWIEAHHTYNHYMLDESFQALYQGSKVNEP